MQEVADLRRPLDEVGQLKEPITRLAAWLDHPAFIVTGGLVFLAMWGLVTYFSVKLAIIKARA